jgi:hypothetical protein
VAAPHQFARARRDAPHTSRKISALINLCLANTVARMLNGIGNSRAAKNIGNISLPIRGGSNDQQ